MILLWQEVVPNQMQAPAVQGNKAPGEQVGGRICNSAEGCSREADLDREQGVAGAGQDAVHAPCVVQVRGQDAVGGEGGAGVEGGELLPPRVELGCHAGVAGGVGCRRHHLGHRLQKADPIVLRMSAAAAAVQPVCGVHALWLSVPCWQKARRQLGGSMQHPVQRPLFKLKCGTAVL